MAPATSTRVRLQFATVGSVDDGKTTLTGRLLQDSKSIFEDQLEDVEVRDFVIALGDPEYGVGPSGRFSDRALARY